MVKLALDAVRSSRARARGRPRRRHGRRAVRRARHDEPDEGRDGMTSRRVAARRREAHFPRHGNELRRSAARMWLRRLSFDRSARQANARRRRRRDATAARVILIDTPPELRLQLLAAGHRPRGRGAVHARSRRSHARHRRPARDHGAPRHAPADVRLRRHARRARAEVRLHLRRQHPAAARHVEAAGTRDPARSRASRCAIADVDVTAGRRAARTGDGLRAIASGRSPTSPTRSRCPTTRSQLLRGARVLVINALFRTPHPSHLSIPEAVGAARADRRRAHVSDAPHARQLPRRLEAELPPGIVAGVRRPHHPPSDDVDPHSTTRT